MNSPTKRSLAKLRAAGYLVAIVERWNPYAKVRQDLFGFIDLLALKGDETLAVQTTTGSNVAARFEKIRNTEAGHNAGVWLESPSRKLVIHGWRKVGPRGKRKVWECRELPVIRTDITLLAGDSRVTTNEQNKEPAHAELAGINNADPSHWNFEP